MARTKQIARFFTLLAASYVALMLLMPGVRPTYAKMFRACNQFILGSYGQNGEARFLPANTPGSSLDCRVILENRRRRTNVSMTFSSGVGYTPSAFLAALLIATPLAVKRRVNAFLWGMLLVHAVVSLTLYLQITFLFGSHPRIATFSLSVFWREVLNELVHLVLFAPFFSMVVPIFVWVLVTFRRGDFLSVMNDRSEGCALKGKERARKSDVHWIPHRSSAKNG